MPKHKVYIECFLGSGAVLRNKKPARFNFGIDINKEVFQLFDNVDIDRNVFDFFEKTTSKTQLISGDVIEKLKNFDSLKNLCVNCPSLKDYLIYLDPPYLRSVRSSKKRIYKNEFWTEEEHTELLEILLNLKCNVMISGYESELYNKMLKGWRKISFNAITRRGMRTETLWMNFPEPLELHDYSYLGSDYRERFRIKQKMKRWKNRLAKMPSQERFALMSAIEELKLQ